ncbi:MAG TPA: FAD-binding oxidoreductase [Vicinamibacterales bacterium]|nr:FAD-binding oxidoreductase [Vicinamibacterales bacterium]
MKRTADVVVVGGGCMGASVAYHLARRGITDVVVVEREKMLGTGSTGRNAGGVRHQFSHEANIRLSIESIALLERFADEVGQAIDFHQDGYLFLLSSSQSVETFRRNVALQRSLGVEVQWLDGADAARLAPGLNADEVLGATFCQRDGIADPNGVTMGFARAAQALGVSIERDTEVTGIRVERDRITGVETSRGAIETRRVVNAAGPYARQVGLMAGAEVPVDPYRRHIFIATLEPVDRGTRMPASRIMVIDFETTFYFHREGAGLLFGMGDKHETPTFDTTVQWDFLPQVIEVAVTRLPALAEASISHAWAGLYEVTPDANPIIGPAHGVDGLFLINGFSGHGFQHSPAAGRVLADVIAGRDPHFDLQPFAADRFAARPADAAETRTGAVPGERYFV